MDKCRVNIAIIEPSSIVYEGLSNILLQESCNYNIYHFDTIEEVFSENPTGEIDLVIANPSAIKNGVKISNSHKKNGAPVIWAALIYSFFERELIDSFDAIIQITDPPEMITRTIHNLVSVKCQCRTENNREQLTPRETDVLKQLVQGLSNKEIADQLNISIHTVVSHRKNIVQKTGIKSQSGLTIYAISNNIINIDDYQE